MDDHRSINYQLGTIVFDVLLYHEPASYLPPLTTGPKSLASWLDTWDPDLSARALPDGTILIWHTHTQWSRATKLLYDLP